MVCPKKSDRLVIHLMSSDYAKEPTAYSSSEESEYNTLKYDIEKGTTLPSHKMKRLQELKEKLGK